MNRTSNKYLRVSGIELGDEYIFWVCDAEQVPAAVQLQLFGAVPTSVQLYAWQRRMLIRQELPDSFMTLVSLRCMQGSTACPCLQVYALLPMHAAATIADLARASKLLGVAYSPDSRSRTSFFTIAAVRRGRTWLKKLMSQGLRSAMGLGMEFRPNL